MRRFTGYALAFVAGVFAGVTGLQIFNWSRHPHGRERITLTSLSPDETVRVTLVELPHLLDRNFELRLDSAHRGGRERTIIFRSPDEDRPEGTERVVWAVDGSRFLLVGRHFHVNAHAPRVPAGTSEVAYLMYELPTGRLWCNSAQQTTHPTFTWDDLKVVRWQDGWPAQ